MTRTACGPATKGSQHWLQVVANQERQLFDLSVSHLGLAPVQWLSPLACDDFAEYRDEGFLRLLGLQLPQQDIISFWPARGPRWDGLARFADGSVLLIEAKANLPELGSSGTRASATSAARIAESMQQAKPSFGAPASADWTSTYYQYANRLAHLHLLRACNQIEAYLVFVYFTGASDVNGPRAREEWLAPITAAHHALGLATGPLTPFIVDAFIDVAHLLPAS